MARAKQEVAITKRKESYDSGKCLRSLDVGTLVLLRVPGFDLKLQDAWKGPYKIIERPGEVNYRVEDLKKGHKSKVVHINNTKEYVERTELVGRISIVLEEEDAGLSQVVVDGIRAEGFCQEELEGVLKKFDDVLRDVPGSTDLVGMGIDVGEATPIAQSLYRIPEKVNAPALFQRLMERVLLSCRGYADAYIDDIVVYSMNWKEHMGHISRVEELKKVGMTTRPRKCCWGRRLIIYLGHIVGDRRLAVPEDRVVAMKEYKRPVKKKGTPFIFGRN